MEEFDATVEELEVKLNKYSEQLKLVEAAYLKEKENRKNRNEAGIKEDENANFQNLGRLYTDLLEVVSLTIDLIAFKKSEGDLTSAKTVSLSTSADIDTDDFQENEVPNDDVENSAHKKKNGLSRTLLNRAKIGSFLSDKSIDPRSLIGRTCLAKYQNAYYYAEILQLKKGPNGDDKVLLEFIGWKNREECNADQIKILIPPPPSAVPPGSQVQALYSQDGRWYDCVIVEHSETGYHVKYTEYGNEEEVKFDQIRYRNSIPGLQKDGVAKKKEAKKNTYIIVTPGGYKIPDYLMLKPTDDENQRNIKKRKVQALKRQQKIELLDEDAKTKAESWRAFACKANKKKLCGFISSQPRESIFKSVDKVITKVPVGNAAKSSSIFVPRRKYDFEETEDT